MALIRALTASSGGGGNSFPASDNIKYAYSGTATLTANTTSSFSDSPAYTLNNGDKQLIALRGKTSNFRVYFSASEYFDSVNNIIYIWGTYSGSSVSTDHLSFYTTATQEYDAIYVIYE